MYSHEPFLGAFWHKLEKGDFWFGDPIREGQIDDCLYCGGTGRNFYYSGCQCWACGDQKKKGRGTGKINYIKEEK